MKPRFRIGDYVEVRAVTRTARVLRSNDRSGTTGLPAGTTYDRTCHKALKREVLTKPLQGWIVGAVLRFEGVINPGGSDSDGEYIQSYLGVTSSKLLWKVARSMTNTPVEAADRDVELLTTCATPWIPGYPMRLGTAWATAGWSPENQRKEMANWPRDNKGHWLKKPKRNSDGPA